MLSFASSHHCGAHWCYEPPRQDRTAKRQPSCERCRSGSHVGEDSQAKFKPYAGGAHRERHRGGEAKAARVFRTGRTLPQRDRKSTRLNSSHRCISYAVFCLKKKKKT